MNSITRTIKEEGGFSVGYFAKNIEQAAQILKELGYTSRINKRNLGPKQFRLRIGNYRRGGWKTANSLVWVDEEGKSHEVSTAKEFNELFGLC